MTYGIRADVALTMSQATTLRRGSAGPSRYRVDPDWDRLQRDHEEHEASKPPKRWNLSFTEPSADNEPQLGG